MGQAEKPRCREVGGRRERSDGDGHLHSARARMLADVRWGLAQEQKQLPSKYFYDTRGSELFEEITELPEYYLTRTERTLLESEVSDWMRELRPRSFVELGAGSLRKTRILLDAMLEDGRLEEYAPVDVAGDFLEAAAADLRPGYPGVLVSPQVKDITTRLDFADALSRPVLFALIGSTIGNFDPAAAIDLLGTVAQAMDRDDRFLLGIDRRPGPRKTVEDLESAYNDDRGVTADFNLNVLAVLNRGIGTDFDLDAFRHRAHYDAQLGRIEMHLVSTRAQVVNLPSVAEVVIGEGETIRTEISCKYDLDTVASLFDGAGLTLDRWCSDVDERYSLALARPQ